MVEIIKRILFWWFVLHIVHPWMIHCHLRCFQWKCIIHCHIYVCYECYFCIRSKGIIWNVENSTGIQLKIWRFDYSLTKLVFFMQRVLCFSLMKCVSEVTQWGIISTCIDKEAKVSFHGSPWNVDDDSCLLTKASLQLLGRTHEIATSPRPVAVILDTFGL